MTLSVALAMAGLLLGGPARTDTIIVVPAGARLDVRPMAGEIVVRTWARNEVRVEAEHSNRQEIRVVNEGSVVRVEARSRQGAPGIVDYQITVPTRMNLSLGGVNVDIDVEGSQGQVEAQTVNGDVRVIGGGGLLNLQSVNGDVHLENASGAMSVGAVNGSVRLRNVRGPVDVETVSGRIIMERIEAARVSASTVSGRIFYDGTIDDGGRYAFSTHSGSITLAIPSTANATITAAQVNGSLTSALAGLTAGPGDRGRRRTYTLGTGEAVIDAESFSGSIRVVERGTVTP